MVYDGDSLVTSPIWYARRIVTATTPGAREVALAVLPNPAVGTATRPYCWPKASAVRAEVLDAVGRRVTRSAAGEQQAAGPHTMRPRHDAGTACGKLVAEQAPRRKPPARSTKCPGRARAKPAVVTNWVHRGRGPTRWPVAFALTETRLSYTCTNQPRLAAARALTMNGLAQNNLLPLPAVPYVPRPTTEQACAHCGQPFAARHLRRKYCCNSCNVLASYARTGRRAAAPTKADLERVVAAMAAMVTAPLPLEEFMAQQAVRVQALKARKQTARDRAHDEALLAFQREQTARIQALKDAKRAASPPSLGTPS